MLAIGTAELTRAITYAGIGTINHCIDITRGTANTDRCQRGCYGCIGFAKYRENRTGYYFNNTRDRAIGALFKIFCVKFYFGVFAHHVCVLANNNYGAGICSGGYHIAGRDGLMNFCSFAVKPDMAIYFLKSRNNRNLGIGVCRSKQIHHGWGKPAGY